MIMRKTLLRLALPAVLVLGAPCRVGAQEPRQPESPEEAYSLTDLLRLGRELHPELLSLRAQRDALTAGRRDASRFQNPELAYGAGTGEPFGSSETRSIRELVLQQTLENPVARHYRLAALEAEVEAAEEGVRAGTLEVDREIRRHFYGILYLGEVLELARLNEEALGEVRELIETRARAGEVRELEAIRLRVEHMKAQNELQAAELELAQFRQHLNLFLGGVLPEDYALEGELTADLGVPEWKDLKERLLPRHPLLQQAEKHREAASRRAGVSRFGWIPSPVLSAASGREMDGDIFKLGIGLQIPLWNQSRAAVERDRQILRQREHEKETLRMELEANLMIHHNRLLLDRQALVLFQEGLLEEADASMDIAETGYREGEISLVEYLDAHRTSRSIQIEYLQALYDWNQELAELDRAAGGGIL